VRIVTLLIVFLLSFSDALPAGAEAPECTNRKRDSGLCFGGGTNGSSVEISGSHASPGSGSDPTGAVEGGGSSDVPPGTSSPSTDGSGLGGNPRRIVDSLDPCITPTTCPPAHDGTPAVTLSDLASFAPSAPTIRMEPDGWMLRGLPANFLAVASEETVTGTLLGHPIDVRFEPASYTWVWGDGESDTVSTPGRTWEQLRLPRFSETATSHTYAERGSVTVSLRVTSTVSYRFDGGDWRTVDGSITATTEIDAYVGSAQTVLVPDDCRTAPDADGC
jgi:hypothetical protein